MFLLFLFLKKTTYISKKNQKVVYFCDDRGPCFYGSFFYIISIKESILKDKANAYIHSESYFKGIWKDYELNN